MDTSLRFPRKDLCERLAKQVLSLNIGSATSSGVFLASPYGTGKSTFIREDLRPAFEAKGAIVVYAMAEFVQAAPQLSSVRESTPG